MQRRDQPPARTGTEAIEGGRGDDRPRHAGVLALQRSAGNQAVGALLAREPDAGAPKDEAQPTGGAVATVPGIGAIPLLSWHFGTAPPTSISGGTSGKANVTEVSFTSKQGDHSPKLQRALLDGTMMDVTVVARLGDGSTFRVTFKGAIVSSFSLPGNEKSVEAWSLNFTSFEQARDGGPAAPPGP